MIFMPFTADFETITNPVDARVWAWAICDINNPDNVKDGIDMDGFIRYIFKNKITPIYFHNLKFDGEFIVSWLLKNEYKWTDNIKDNEGFTTLIARTGQWYKIVINKKGTRITIMDSLKLLNMKVEAVAKMFDIPEQKLKIDYEAYRAKGHQLTDEEREYLHHDVVIMAKALKIIFDQGYTKMTQGANALEDYKNIIGKRQFTSIYPPPLYDKDVRMSYKGGWCYLNPIFAGEKVKEAYSLDVNSLYPSRMYYEELPYGDPVTFSGKYPEDGIAGYPLYIVRFRCDFRLKKNKHPSLQLKNSPSYANTEYAIDSKGEVQDICLTNPDLELFFEQYDVFNIEWYGGYAFRSSDKKFRAYIDKWINIKIDSKNNGNVGMYQWSKIMLNSLYGKFGTNPNGELKKPYLDEKGIVKMQAYDGKEREPIYIPLASFITAYARKFTIEQAQKVTDYSIEKYGKDMFIYSDTDSIKTTLPLDDIIKLFDIDSTRLGAWDLEKRIIMGVFLRAKTYMTIGHAPGKMAIKTEVTCAGMPENVKKTATFENFAVGAKYEGKLRPRHCPGGIVFEKTSFVIRK